MGDKDVINQVLNSDYNLITLKSCLEHLYFYDKHVDFYSFIMSMQIHQNLSKHKSFS